MYDWNFSSTLFEVVYVVLVVATLSATLWIGLRTLNALGRYVEDTAKLARSSAEQVEALRTPCLVLELIETQPMIVVKNVGSGPALNIRYRIEEVSEPKSAGPFEEKGLHIPAEGRHNSPRGRGEMNWKDFRFVAEYESLGGRRYRSDIRAPGHPSVTRYELSFGQDLAEQ